LSPPASATFSACCQASATAAAPEFTDTGFGTVRGINDFGGFQSRKKQKRRVITTHTRPNWGASLPRPVTGVILHARGSVRWRYLMTAFCSIAVRLT
jgi:hypothetical protein